MSRAEVVTLIQLTLVTVALAVPLGLLAAVGDLGYGQWADAALAAGLTALALLLPTTLVLLLRAAWSSGPDAARAVRSRIQDWRQWRGIQRVDEQPRTHVRDDAHAEDATLLMAAVGGTS